jgi:uncharacterized integral membrane protein (TIGR00697 family)
VLVLSNIASSAKIGDLGFAVFGLHLAFDGGTLLFPLAYVLGDILTEVYGFKASRKVIYTGFVLLVFSALVLKVLGYLPGEAHWEEEAGSKAYSAILGGMSSGGIVLASLSAYFVGNWASTVLLSKLKVLMKGRLIFLRVGASILTGEFLDTFIFVSIACLTGVFPWELFLSLTVTIFILKCIIEALLLPATAAIAGRLKKGEGVDVYDIGVKYKLFA